MSDNSFKPSIFNPLTEYFREVKSRETTSFRVFVDAKHDEDEMFQKDEVTNLYQEFGNEILNSELTELVGVKKSVLMGMILLIKPEWLKLLKKGRSDFFTTIKDYEDGFQITQLFNESNLNENNLQSMYWWAYIESYFKNDNWNKRKIGIDGEFLSYNYELNKLKELKIKEKPILTSIDSTDAGYDLVSYRKDSEGLIHKIYIESKFNSQNQLAFYISRNEASKALELNERYYLYLWTKKDQKEPHIIKVNYLKNNLPKDCGDSTWKEAFIKTD